MQSSNVVLQYSDPCSQISKWTPCWTPGFERFMCKYEDTIPTRDDRSLVFKLCNSMAEYYDTESARVKAFKSIVDDYFGIVSYSE